MAFASWDFRTRTKWAFWPIDERGEYRHYEGGFETGSALRQGLR